MHQVLQWMEDESRTWLCLRLLMSVFGYPPHTSLQMLNTDTFPLPPTGRFEPRKRRGGGRRDGVVEHSLFIRHSVPGFLFWTPERYSGANPKRPKIWNASDSLQNYRADLHIVAAENKDWSWFCVMNGSKHT